MCDISLSWFYYKTCSLLCPGQHVPTVFFADLILLRKNNHKVFSAGRGDVLGDDDRSVMVLTC